MDQQAVDVAKEMPLLIQWARELTQDQLRAEATTLYRQMVETRDAAQLINLSLRLLAVQTVEIDILEERRRDMQKKKTNQ